MREYIGVLFQRLLDSRAVREPSPRGISRCAPATLPGDNLLVDSVKVESGSYSSLSFCEERIPPLTAGVNPTIPHGPRSAANTDIYVESRRSMTHTEAGIHRPNKRIVSGLRDPVRSRHRSRTAVVSRLKITPSPPAGDRSNGGVAPPSARHADGSSTSKYPNSAVRCRGKPRRSRRGGGHS
jgi:hypothetical protein